MAKIIKITESDLHRTIKNTVSKILSEGMDEMSPEFLLHAAERAKADKKNYPGRKDARDLKMKAKRDRQHDLFSAGAADQINKELGDEDFHVSSDRGARTLKMDKGTRHAFLRPDSDFDTTRLYDDNWQEGDEPLTMASLEPDEYERAKGMFDKFKGFHDRASALEESRIKEIVAESVKKVLKEDEEYRKAREYAENMDWYAYGISSPGSLTWQDLDELAFDASMTTRLSKDVLLQAMADCISDMGYKLNESVKKNVIKLNESTLRNIVAESVKKVLREWEDDPDTGVDDFWAEMDPEVARRSKNRKDDPETIKKAQEVYDKLMSECPNGYGDWEFDITEEGIDGPYTFDGVYYTDYEDENGGTWHFDVGCSGYQDANETKVEDTSYVEFTSPDGQCGIVPER